FSRPSGTALSGKFAISVPPITSPVCLGLSVHLRCRCLHCNRLSLRSNLRHGIHAKGCINIDDQTRFPEMPQARRRHAQTAKSRLISSRLFSSSRAPLSTQSKECWGRRQSPQTVCRPPCTSSVRLCFPNRRGSATGVFRFVHPRPRNLQVGLHRTAVPRPSPTLPRLSCPRRARLVAFPKRFSPCRCQARAGTSCQAFLTEAIVSNFLPLG